MKNKKLLLLSLAIPLFAITSYASADNTSTSTNSKMEEIKLILDKQKAWETLTTDEQTLLTEFESKKKEFSWSWETMKQRWFWMINWSWSLNMTDEQKAEMEQIKIIMGKKKNGETLTTDEEELLAKFEANKPEKKDKTNKSENKTVKFSNKVNDIFKTKIDKKVENINSKFSTNETKIEWLKSFLAKVEKMKTQINSSDITDSKKETYDAIFEYFIESLNNKINELNWNSTTSDDLSDLLDSLDD